MDILINIVSRGTFLDHTWEFQRYENVYVYMQNVSQGGTSPHSLANCGMGKTYNYTVSVPHEYKCTQAHCFMISVHIFSSPEDKSILERVFVFPSVVQKCASAHDTVKQHSKAATRVILLCLLRNK